MIMTVAELRQFVTTDGIDPALLEARLQALELLIRGYTNNNFQKRPFRAVAVADYVALNKVITAEDSRVVIAGRRYDVLLIDDPMELHKQLEIYLRYTGGQ